MFFPRDHALDHTLPAPLRVGAAEELGAGRIGKNAGICWTTPRSRSAAGYLGRSRYARPTGARGLPPNIRSMSSVEQKAGSREQVTARQPSRGTTSLVLATVAVAMMGCPLLPNLGLDVDPLSSRVLHHACGDLRGRLRRRRSAQDSGPGGSRSLPGAGVRRARHGGRRGAAGRGHVGDLGTEPGLQVDSQGGDASAPEPAHRSCRLQPGAVRRSHNTYAHAVRA